MRHRTSLKRTATAVFAVLVAASFSSAAAQRTQRDTPASGRDISILVTVHPHNARTREAAPKIKADDFVVREDKRPQQIISVKQPSEAPPIIAVLVQDDLVSHVNNEIKGLKDFIKRLPD